MNEIEVKAKLHDKEKILEHLKNAGAIFLGTKYQKDIAFWPNDIKDTNQHLLGRNYMRIREQKTEDKSTIIFTVKQSLKDQLDCREVEIEIKENDIPKIREMMDMLDYYEFVIIEKNRTTAKLGDVEICLDDVTGLGSYIELEKFGNQTDTDTIKKELYNMLKSWNIDEEDYVYVGYDILIKDKK